MIQLTQTTGSLIRSIVSLAASCRQYTDYAMNEMQVGHKELANVFTDVAEMEKRQACFLLDQLAQYLETEQQDSEIWAACFRMLNELAEQEGFVQIGTMYQLLLSRTSVISVA
ncbi:MAG: hypothetical protein PHQ83_10775 [Eubacteriales bacterium]|nr:hypothetical protein [Eubacteriales bacterium]